jgi:hypothetical protein
MSSLNRSTIRRYITQTDPDYDFDLIYENGEWQFFWDELAEPNHSFEIFTVSYHPQPEDWSAVIQLTDTNTITDDYFEENLTSSISFIVVLLGLLIGRMICKKEKFNF